jgi:hypothetical protein
MMNHKVLIINVLRPLIQEIRRYICQNTEGVYLRFVLQKTVLFLMYNALKIYFFDNKITVIIVATVESPAVAQVTYLLATSSTFPLFDFLGSTYITSFCCK